MATSDNTAPVAGAGALVAGGETQVNTVTAGHQVNPSVTVLANGSYVVVWRSGDGDGYGIFGQLYAADGTKVGGAFQVNHYEVVALADGGFVVAWLSHGWTVAGGLYDASGTPLGGEFLLGSPGAVPLSLTALDDGGFVVASRSGPSSGTLIVSSFNSSGKQTSSVATLINNAGTNSPDLATMPDGSTAAMAYTAANSVVYLAFVVSGALTSTVQFSPGSGWDPAVAAQEDGTVFVTWTDDTIGDVYSRFYTSNWCIEQANDGEKITDDSPAMTALEAYIYWTARGSKLDPGRH